MQHTLFLLQPGFYDGTEGPFYCPYCASLEGLIGGVPEIERAISVKRIEFVRPRKEIIPLIGEEHQSCPVLVLGEGAEIPTEAAISSETGRAFIDDWIKIGSYLATTLGIVRPH